MGSTETPLVLDTSNSPMSQHLELFAALAAPFEPDEVRIRPQGARQLQYITARTVMNRLDDVLGPENWWDEYQPLEHSVICRLTIKLPDGTTLTKSDAGGYAGMPDSGDDDKSGFSDSFKRAAVKFGIGRYLYRDGVPRIWQEQWKHPSAASETRLPHPAAPAQPAAPAPAAARSNSNGDGQNAPQTGKALFAWTKQQDEKSGIGLLKTLSDWAKLRDFPAKMIHWSPEQVQLAYAEACAVIQGSPGPAIDSPHAANGAANGQDYRHAPNLNLTGREAAPKERPAGAVPPGAAHPKGSGALAAPSRPKPLRQQCRPVWQGRETLPHWAATDRGSVRRGSHDPAVPGRYNPPSLPRAPSSLPRQSLPNSLASFTMIFPGLRSRGACRQAAIRAESGLA